MKTKWKLDFKLNYSNANLVNSDVKNIDTDYKKDCQTIINVNKAMAIVKESLNKKT